MITQAKIEQAAFQLLQQTNLLPTVPSKLVNGCVEVDVKEAARSRGVKLIEYDFGDDISGVLLFDKGEVVIGFSKNNGLNRQRFTIAHELGHFILEHQTKGVFVDTPDKYFPPKFRDKNSSTGEFEQERQANSFAAALLMPEGLIREVLDKIKEQRLHLKENYNLVDQLAKFFAVSPQAMLFRLNRLNIWEDSDWEQNENFARIDHDSARSRIS